MTCSELLYHHYSERDEKSLGKQSNGQDINLPAMRQPC